MAPLSRRKLLAAGISSGVALLAGCLSDNTDDWDTDETLQVASAVQYQSPNCNCCDVYAEYLDDHLEPALTVEQVENLDAIKADHGIHADLRSCHTVELDGYVVEGHIPVEIVSSMLADQPDLTGISLPGMPSGSPGMPGEKDEPWTIYGFDEDGYFEYDSL